MGRLTRPLMIVYNNKRDNDYVEKKATVNGSDDNSEHERTDFVQGLKITYDDIIALKNREKTLEDLKWNILNLSRVRYQ